MTTPSSQQTLRLRPDSSRSPSSAGRGLALGAWARQAALLLAVGVALACNSASGDGNEGDRSAAAEAPQVEVFVTDWCPYCQRLEAFLKENQVAYQRKNIEEDATARAEHGALGGGGIPVTRIGGDQVVRGFRPDVIAKLLDLDTD